MTKASPKGARRVHPIVIPSGLRLLLALTLLIPPMQAAMGSILCIGDDGHVAIEAMGPRGDCDEPAIGPRSGVDLSGHHCGDCQDVSTSFDEVTRSRELINADMAPAIHIAAVFFSGLNLNTRPAPRAAPSVPRRSPSDQKIVLII